MKKRSKVMIVDDHAIVREGLARLISAEPDLEVCASCSTTSEAMEILRSAMPDVAVVDVSLSEGAGGLELVKWLKKEQPKLPTLVMSMHEESLYAQRALRAGARGYIMKAEASEKVMEAIRRILKGQIYLSDSMTGHVLEQVSAGASASGMAIASLSDRELDVFERIGHGQTTRDIAEKLHLSIKTIETYRENIKTKLQLKDSTELVQRAIQWAESSS